MTKVLITGGCGFIGSHLVESFLKDNHEVSVLDKYNIFIWQISEILMLLVKQ